MPVEMIPLWETAPPYYQQDYQTEPNENTATITPFCADGSAAKPALLICPGGGFTHRAEHEGSTVAKYFQSAGIHAYVLNYRVIPYSPFISLMDALRAIRFLRFHSQKFGILQDKIGILGFSAGGCIAGYVSELFDQELFPSVDEIDQISARPDAAVLCYAGLSFRKEHLIESDYEILLKSFHNMKTLSNSVESFANQYSCDQLIRPDMPPVFLWHTIDDKRVPVSGVINYIQKLDLQHISSEIHLFPNGGHGLGIEDAKKIPGVNQWPQLCMNWLHQQGF